MLKKIEISHFWKIFENVRKAWKIFKKFIKQGNFENFKYCEHFEKQNSERFSHKIVENWVFNISTFSVIF